MGWRSSLQEINEGPIVSWRGEKLRSDRSNMVERKGIKSQAKKRGSRKNAGFCSVSEWGWGREASDSSGHRGGKVRARSDSADTCRNIIERKGAVEPRGRGGRCSKKGLKIRAKKEEL